MITKLKEVCTYDVTYYSIQVVILVFTKNCLVPQSNILSKSNFSTALMMVVNNSKEQFSTETEVIVVTDDIDMRPNATSYSTSTTIIQ